MSLLISVDELNDLIQAGKKTTILACMWAPGENAGYDQYRKAHIPTAVFCDPASFLTATPSAQDGRNPLPTKQILKRGFNTWGLNKEHEIIVYDGERGLLAARAWWTLTWAGVENVRLLDGSLPAWTEAGFAQVGGPGNLAQRPNLLPEPGALSVATMEDVRDLGDKILIDVREPSRFAGKKEFLDKQAGHIPGAVNLPVWEFFHPDNTFRSPGKIKRLFEGVGVRDPKDVIVYSGSGLHSSLALAAMHYAGLPGAAHYVGGWSQWCSERSRPVETAL